MSKPITRYNDVVKSILENNARARDDDNYLYCLVVYKWVKRNSSLKPVDEMTAKELLIILSHNPHAPNHQGVSRCRRKLQELDKKLRGKKWDERHNKMQDDVKEDLGYNTGSGYEYDGSFDNGDDDEPEDGPIQPELF